MLVIREEQLFALGRATQHVLAERLLDPVRRHFPIDCAMLGETQVRAVIELGLERAARHEFRTTGEGYRYVCLMFMFGSLFDEDPQLAWAEEILASTATAGPPEVRMDRLYGAAVEFLEEVAGAKGEYYSRALLRARGLSFDDLYAGTTAELDGQMDGLLRRLYPRKCERLGADGLGQVKNLAQQSAREAGLDSAQGILVFLALMFLLGSHFAKDPLYPWAAAALAEAPAMDPVVRARLLYERAMERLDAYLACGAAQGSA